MRFFKARRRPVHIRPSQSNVIPCARERDRREGETRTNTRHRMRNSLHPRCEGLRGLPMYLRTQGVSAPHLCRTT